MTKYPEGHVFYRKMAHDYPVIERAEGIYLYEAGGRRYLDASGGPLVVNIGHGVKEVVEAMARQAAEVAYVHGSLFTTAALETYSERLAARVPLPDPRFYYLSGGAEAVETAVKFARQVQVGRDEERRDRIIARWGSYHGATLGTLALSGKPEMRNLFAPMFQDMPHIEAPYCYRCPFDEAQGGSFDEAQGGSSDGGCGHCDLQCARQLEIEILRQGPERVAAFIGEPIGGATLGGIVPPDDYWPLVREICDRYGVMLIADEVLTGFGRTGAWFAMEHAGVQPDVMVLAKGAAGGYAPLSIVAVRGRDVETIRQAHGDFNHGGTFSHHAVGAAAALATLNYLEAHNLVGRVADVGQVLGQRLRAAVGDLPAVGDVRGIGMLWAVEFVADRETKEPYPPEVHFASQVTARCREMGVLLYPGHGSVDGVRGDHLMVAPPYIVIEEQIDEITATLRRAIEAVTATV
jgi:adenosylmethionine-8-amino-7-oxononanoate aminotransferase